MNKIVQSAAAISIVACLAVNGSVAAAVDGQPLLQAYADLATDAYDHAFADARELQQAIGRLAAEPTEKTHAAARAAWLAARESYGVTEIFRLVNGPIDAESGWVADAYGSPEGRINSWPLDENLIDYTIDANGQRTSGNIIDTPGVFHPRGQGAEAVDVGEITPAALMALNENGGDSNVASGYHAIEFLLWGQDQDYANFSIDAITHGPLTAGQRPLSDFTSAPYAKRRLQYLQAAAALLVSDLETVAAAWNREHSGRCASDATGCYRAALLGRLDGDDREKNIPPETALRQIVAGMGVFTKSELANERIAVAVLTPSEEDEQSCFSDNTHRDITRNYRGFLNVLKAEFDGKSYGDSLYRRASEDTRRKLDRLIEKIDARIARMNSLAADKWHFDYQILPGNNDRDIRNLKNDLRRLGDTMVAVAGDIGLSLTAGDVTDPGETRI